MTRTHFRIGGRRAGVVKPAAVTPEPDATVAAAAPEPAIESPRERLRFVRPRTVEAPTRAMKTESESMNERLIETLTTALTALASNPGQPVALHVAPSTVELKMPDQPLANVEVHVPERSVEVHVPERSVDVHVPEQAAPTVHVTNEVATPNVLVAAPEVTVQAPPAAVVEVNVDVPQQPAPVVHVENKNTVEVPRPRPVRVEKHTDGTVRYVPEDA